MRYLYSLMLYLILPWVVLRLWLKGFQLPDYRRNWKERFGFGHATTRGDEPVWVHAVSVGEVRAAQPLIHSLLSDLGSRPVLMTTSTPTGRETVRRLFGETVSYRYLPYDLPGSVRRFIESVRPAVAVIMETEIWPNLYYQLHLRSIPLLLVNARLSQRSVKRYLRFRALSRQALGRIRHIAAQSDQDARHFALLGAGPQQLSVVGNLKYDAQLPVDFVARVTALKSALAAERPIWVAGSTHEGEETQLLAAHRRVRQTFSRALLIIVPRHPQRASAVGRLCAQEGVGFQYLSQLSAPLDGSQALIVDTLGDLVYLYGLARVAFVGGSLAARGGHNPLEPVLAGAPVVVGPDVSNFQAVYRELISAGAVKVIHTEAALADRVCGWFADRGRRDAAVAAGLRVIEKNQGALRRSLDLIHAELGALSH